MKEILAALSSEDRLATSDCSEYSWGWLFCYNTEEYLNGDPDAALLGNAPYIINKYTGEVAITGTCGPVSAFIAAYEKHLEETEGLTPEERSSHWSNINKNASWL